MAGTSDIDQFRYCPNCSADELHDFFNNSKDPFDSFKLIQTEGSKGPVVLFHGLTDSPYYMKDIANLYFQNGYDVYVPLIKGHGDTYSELESIQAEEWNKQVESFISQINKRYSQNVMVGGFSNGGLLSTLAALNDNIRDKISSLLLLSPAMNLSTSKPKQLVLSTLRSFESWTHSINWKIMKASMRKILQFKVEKGKLKGIRGQVRYDSIPLNSVLQLAKNMNQLNQQARTKSIDIPTVMVLSSNDSTVSVSAAVERFKTLFVGEKHMIWIQNYGSEARPVPTSIPAKDISVVPVRKLLGHVITLRNNGLARANEANASYGLMEQKIREILFQSGQKTCMSIYSN